MSLYCFHLSTGYEQTNLEEMYIYAQKTPTHYNIHNVVTEARYSTDSKIWILHTHVAAAQINAICKVGMNI